MDTFLSPDAVDLSKYIEMRDDRPQIRGRRLPIAFIATAYHGGTSVHDLAYQFTLNTEQVLAALLYYHEHKAIIDAQDMLDAAESDQLHARFGGLPGQR